MRFVPYFRAHWLGGRFDEAGFEGLAGLMRACAAVFAAAPFEGAEA